MADNQGPDSVAPSFQGRIETTLDALLLVEASIQGYVPHVPRRVHERERADLIVSGNVFIYEEHASGIKRWTDGVAWSPSRILDNFLVYRELKGPFPAGEKKRALKKDRKSSGGIVKPSASSPAPINPFAIRNGSFSAGPFPDAPFPGSNDSFSNPAGQSNDVSETERRLVGSLVDSYEFKESGLVKKTISITYRNVTHHIVGYYTVQDAEHLITPTRSPELRQFIPRSELLYGNNFRAPLDGATQDQQGGYFLASGGYIPPPLAIPPPQPMGQQHMGQQHMGQQHIGQQPIGHFAPLQLHQVPQQAQPPQQPQQTQQPPFFDPNTYSANGTFMGGPNHMYYHGNY